MKISVIHSRQILDSRGNPTVETDVILEDGSIGRASVPSGASTGINEALELRDGDKTRYGGKGVLKAVENVNTQISKLLQGTDAENQSSLDQLMIDLDGTENKSNLGANSILSVSLAAAKATAVSQKLPLFKYFTGLSSIKRQPLLPLPMMNIINGGKHANWSADLQEYMIFPIGAKNFPDALRMGAEVFHSLGKVLVKQGYNTLVGDEGGYAPQVKKGNGEPFDLIKEAVENTGYRMGGDIVFGLDGAASEFYEGSNYSLKAEDKKLSTKEMILWLEKMSQKYPIVSMEDCLDQEDWNGWQELTSKLGKNIQIVGDDLLVTNIKFLEKAIQQKSANSILIKLNQIGTLTETIKAIEMAHQAGWRAVISHRSGETEDTTIAHLVVGLATGQIKTGSLSRSDRVAKYNELLRIGEILGNEALYAGESALKKNG